MQPMGNDIDVHLGKRLRRRRRLLGLTQQQLAGACGVRFQQIQKYECGANRISAARLWQLSEALEVPVGYFYDGLTDAARREIAGGEAGEAGRDVRPQGNPGSDPRLLPARRAPAPRLLDLGQVAQRRLKARTQA